jgi:hypothetical protein
MRDGRSYCSDGLTHLFDFEVNGLGVGEPGDGGRPSFLATAQGAALTVRVKTAALLEETPREDVRKQPMDEHPYWHVERARLGDARVVPVELIVNGEAVEQKVIEADGKIHEVAFDFRPLRSCWVAVRIFPAAHTNPIFVEVDHQPIRASRRSAGGGSRSTAVGRRSRRSSGQRAGGGAGPRTTTPGTSISRLRASRSTTAN